MYPEPFGFLDTLTDSCSANLDYVNSSLNDCRQAFYSQHDLAFALNIETCFSGKRSINVWELIAMKTNVISSYLPKVATWGFDNLCYPIGNSDTTEHQLLDF